MQSQIVIFFDNSNNGLFNGQLFIRDNLGEPLSEKIH